MQDLVLDKFPTHIAKTDNKIASNKYVKITNQSIYSGLLNRFARAIAVKNIHSWINSQLSNQILPKITEPIQLQLSIYTVINHGDIRRKKDGSISWNKPSEGYIPRWDEDNLRTIWEKCIKDVLTDNLIWTDDTVYICRGTNSMIYFVDDLEDRKIILNFKKI
jgi:hypothetical protein